MGIVNKKASRERRGKRTRAHIERLQVPRLTVHKTPRHSYAQVIFGGKVLAVASTLEKSLASQLSYTGNVAAATVIGRIVAERAQKAGVKKVAFDRSGFKYHGRVKALADAAREAGLEF